VDNRFPQAADHRPEPGVLEALEPSCRILLRDRELLDNQFLTALGGLLAEGHPLRQYPGAALDLLDVVLRTILSGDPPQRIEDECQECGMRCAVMGLPDDTFPAVGRAIARAAREVAADAWTSTTSSGWAAVHVWVVEHFTAGAVRARSQGKVWHPFPELAPSETSAPDTAPQETVSRDSEWDLLEQAAGRGGQHGDDQPQAHGQRLPSTPEGRHGRRASRDPGQAPGWMRDAWVAPEWVSNLWGSPGQEADAGDDDRD
jgi:hypothetical protein